MPQNNRKAVDQKWSKSDALLVIKMVRPHSYGRFDWLYRLDEVSDAHQEETLAELVSIRLRDDPRPPAWIYLAIDYAEKKGWQVPDSWMEILNASVRLYQVWQWREGFGYWAAEWLKGRNQPEDDNHRS